MRPEYRVEANGQDITAAIHSRLVSLSITDESGVQSDVLDIVLADHQDTAPLALPPTGAELRVWLGYDGQAANMGLYIVDEIVLSTPPDRLRIRAKAAPLDASASGAGSTRPLLQTQKTRSWEPQPLGDLVRTIAVEHGLTPAVAASLAAVELPHVDQTNESDMNLLTRLAAQYDAIAKPAGGYLVIVKRGESRTSSGDAMPTVTLAPGDMSAWQVTIAKRASAGTVIAIWHDTEAATDREVAVGDGEPVQRLRHPLPDASTAAEAARAALDHSARGERRLTASGPGRNDLVAESRLITAGFVRAAYNGEWLVTRVQHTLDAGGYRVSVDAEVPGAGGEGEGE